MTDRLPLTTRTAFADLVDRASAAAFEADFDHGNFVSKEIKGRRYWYFETKADGGHRQKYVGVETPELLQRIGGHKQVRDEERDRASVVASLVRANQLLRPDPEIGKVLSALSRAGAFRLGAVLVGTGAYQTYSAMLGVRLPARALQTGDVDVAQSKSVSIAAKDKTPPMLSVLQEVDPSFRAVPHLAARHATSYAASGGLRVEFLTPNDGPDSDVPQNLPALQTDAQPIRFLSYLIRDPVPTVVLSGAGVLVSVPAPERYALHKLIVARRRHQASGKREKDLQQAQALLDALVDDRPADLKAAWADCWRRGKKWRVLLAEGLGEVDAHVRDRTLQVLGMSRDIIPGLALAFTSSVARHDFDSDTVYFLAEAAGTTVRCAISHAALDNHFKPQAKDKEGRLRLVRENRALLERMMTLKYLHDPIEDVGMVLIETEAFEALRKQAQRGR